ncbi:FAD-dependent oxidoreductase [Cyanobium sp. NIES-981]|uniref:FAD-dependent oxidoreductase n=1 Tax=Cyanobium sp. NIES-981 TaxID=1851505 RepID=UPI0007DD6447|nr:FAD-dependent oxidoreductase [Cyanobium sp. NIES-981]SBO42877.1 Oxidoreductase, FAD-binding [Cyanobium sp. NIES-981]
MAGDPRPGPWDVAVVGGGLAGGLLALALADQGLTVILLDAGNASATALSYGLMTVPAAAPWVALQLRHGPLGLRWRWARLAGAPLDQRGLTRWLERLPLPVAQVEAPAFLAALPDALAAAGVAVVRERVRPLPRLPRRSAPPCWPLALEGGALLEARQVVLAAGAGCRTLWPALDLRLRTSWAGVLELGQPPAWSLRWPAQLVVPRRFQRLELEARAAELTRPQWVVDAGLVCNGCRWLAGQVSLVDPQPDPAAAAPHPEAMEARLRLGLAGLGEVLRTAGGHYVQVPVTYCTDARPLVGAVPHAPGLWVFTGFTAAFAQVPRAARCLASTIREATGRKGSRGDQ